MAEPEAAATDVLEQHRPHCDICRAGWSSECPAMRALKAERDKTARLEQEKATGESLVEYLREQLSVADTDGEAWRKQRDAANERVEALERENASLRRGVLVSGGCLCDPVGCGEEFCKGTCYEMAAHALAGTG